jgi:Arylsulfotransferase (ASST)
MRTIARSGEGLKDSIPAVLFVLGISSFAFGYGILVGAYGYFPYEILHDAKSAADALREKHSIPEEPYVHAVDHHKAGVTIYDRDRAFDGYTFLTGYRDGLHRATLIDMEGRVLHEWSAQFSDIWPEAPHVIEQAQDAAIHWHGAYLFANGDILFNFESGNFPYGGGLVKINKNSDVLWTLERNTHHDLDVLEDGTIYVAAHNHIAGPITNMSGLKPPYLEDVILKVSSDGRVLDEISIMDALQKSDYRHLLFLKYRFKGSEDPTHLNTVEILPQNLADKFPMFEAGDILISLHNLNMIGVIDAEREAVKWVLRGMFVQQHDPDFLDNGHIMVFDNWGGRPDRKASQILEIDPVTQEVVWRYRGSAESGFFSKIRGKQQPLPNGNVLITDAQSGRVLEVTREEAPEIVWEYHNAMAPVDGEGRVGLITLAERFEPEVIEFLN